MSHDYLKETIIRLSSSDNWEQARMEWTKAKLIKIDSSHRQSCLCGHKNIKKLFSIVRNDGSEIELYPIGSSCIEKFENEELTKSLKKAEKIYKLKEGDSFQDLRDMMDIELLDQFYEEGYFKEDKENEFNTWNDYILFKMALSRSGKERQLAYNKMDRILYVVNDYLRPELNGIFDIDEYKKNLKLWKKEEEEEKKRQEKLRRAAEEERIQRQKEAREKKLQEQKLQKQKKYDRLLAWLNQQMDPESQEVKDSVKRSSDLDKKIDLITYFKNLKEKQSRQEIENDADLLSEVMRLRRQVKSLYPRTPRAKKCIDYVDHYAKSNREHLFYMKRLLKEVEEGRL
ncbi:hypothetical protein ACVRXQ_06250 [Streptococcus panodentis]|uniref:Phage protein n=1 Tax=Streptococcus panodentis TaxID=1581472 RepID=A0ABS5AVE8_9STRE|nr:MULTISPECIES: hypothetical protein [Streptococcus]KXT83322.1 hypothetical protein STRDD11_01561 [Streptococcus sp. DD11]MBP2620544.1 hypothetical protein [Streptococcus panodentis]